MYGMHYYEVAPTQIIRHESSVFTYSSLEKMELGQIVSIEAGRKKYVGVIIRKVKKPTYETKSIISVVEVNPLPPPLITLSLWLSSYYVTHLAVTMQTMLPRGIQKRRRNRQIPSTIPFRKRTNYLLNSLQTEALRKMMDSSPGTSLLYGVTGSGKTAVYIEAAKRTLDSGKSVIVLVPEIALTPQLVDEFSAHFDNVILTHSRQTEAERHTSWHFALSSVSPRIVIGPRSALFMPLKKIGMIIIDEAHEPSYKQEQSPRYSALRAASILAREHGARLVLGSATPSINDFYLAKASGRPIIEMSSTARPSQPPKVTLIDMTNREQFQRHRFLSDKLLRELQKTFDEGHQALIFHNRRGSTSTTLCDKCGWQATCTRCFIPMTLHADDHQLRCHICGLNDKVPVNCPVCANPSILHKGIGTKLIESELAKIFPNISIGRFDGDTESGQTLDAKYKELYEGSIGLIIGTQVVAKGLDLPLLRTVGIVQADAGLSLPDFAASERTFQLLAQAIGRVGRNEHYTAVIVQSYQPHHPAVKDGLTQSYLAFYEKTVSERKQAHFPPFVFLLKLTCIYKTEAAAIKNARALAKRLRNGLATDVEILGPTPAFYERQRGTYRWQLVLKSTKRDRLVEALTYLPASHWQFELDPISLL